MMKVYYIAICKNVFSNIYSICSYKYIIDLLHVKILVYKVPNACNNTCNMNITKNNYTQKSIYVCV